MQEKTKTQNGFIQIPLLIAIIVSIIGASVATTGVVLHKQGKSIPFIASISQVLKGTEDVKPEIKSEQPQPQPQVEQSLPKETSQEGNSQAEQELKQTKLEAEKVKQETEKVKAENERLKAEQKIQVVEKAKQEAQSIAQEKQKQAEAEALKKTQEEAKIKAEQELQRQLEAKRLVEEQQKQAQQNGIKNTDQELTKLISSARQLINPLSSKKDDINALSTAVRNEMNKNPTFLSVQQSGQQLLSECDNSSFLLGKLIGIVNDQIVELSSLLGSGKAPSNGLWLQYDSYFSQYETSNNKITSLMQTFIDNEKTALEENSSKKIAEIDLANQILSISQQITNKTQEISALPNKVAEEVRHKVNGFEITQSQFERLVATELATRLPQLETELQNLYSQKQQLVIKYNLIRGAGL